MSEEKQTIEMPNKSSSAGLREDDALDSDAGFAAHFSKFMGDCVRVAQQYKNIASAAALLKQECELIPTAAGDQLLTQLCFTWGMLQKYPNLEVLRKDFQDLPLRMSKHYYVSGEFNRVIEYCKTPVFGEELFFLQQKDIGSNAVQAQENDEKLCRAKLIENFSRSCPITVQQLTAIAGTVEKQDYESFINPSKTITSSWNNDTKWYKYCYAALELGSSVSHKDALALYRWYGQARHQIAVKLMHNREEVVFGRLRLDALSSFNMMLYTPLTSMPASRYYDQFSYCSNALKLFENRDSDFVKHITVELNSDKEKKKINVTIILDPVTKVALSKIYRTQNMGYPSIVIIHPAAIHIDTVFNQSIQPLYAELLSSKDPDLIYFNLGKITWYYLQLMPCEGGSAAITLMSMYDSLKKKNLPLTPIAGDVALDFIGCHTKSGFRNF